MSKDESMVVTAGLPQVLKVKVATSESGSEGGAILLKVDRTVNTPSKLLPPIA